LVAALGNPQHRFAAIHVVGTNGKSSVTEMTARLIEAHGVRAGAYLSPHTERWTERVLVGGDELDPDAFGAAIERAAVAVEAVERALEPGDSVTEFEVVTAAAFVALAAAKVKVGVIEAGLGGRLDATNVLLSRVSALTSVGVEHTQWLGETTAEIAGEKLAVLRDHSTLIVGKLDPEIDALAEGTARERHAKLIHAPEAPRSLGLAAPYLRRNFGVAIAAAGEILGELDADRVAEVAAHLELHGRMEGIEAEVPVLLDAAHNPDGARALAEALAERGEGPVVACIAILAEKDAAGILSALAPALDAAVFTEIPASLLQSRGRSGASARLASELAALAAGVETVEAIVDPGGAIVRAAELAKERSTPLLVTGSHYLLGYAARAAR
jgi:dihydrofolate synthase / folylpolyglutamate synthase